ncbi:MAG: hypothetical protein ABW194_02770 [Novosphingobium sp.]
MSEAIGRFCWSPQAAARSAAIAAQAARGGQSLRYAQKLAAVGDQLSPSLSESLGLSGGKRHLAGERPVLPRTPS